MWTLDQLQTRREEILAAAARHGARNVRVFGSVARGEERDDSDVDFLIELEPGRSLFDLAHVIADLEALLRCRVDVVPEANLHPRIRDGVRQEATTL
jgi:uncharacterized protein